VEWKADREDGVQCNDIEVDHGNHWVAIPLGHRAWHHNYSGSAPKEDNTIEHYQNRPAIGVTVVPAWDVWQGGCIDHLHLLPQRG
jgi:hypothetical protein